MLPALALASVLSQAGGDGGVREGPWVEGARAMLETPYEFGGRRRTAAEGLDCYGVVLAGAEQATGCGWRSFPWNPTQLVAAIGAPLDGENPVASADLAIDRLRPGDVVMLVDFIENPKEPAIGLLGGKKVWVWHTGVASSRGRWIVGDHFAGRTVEVDLSAYLAEHADTYAGVYVVRPSGRRPTRCRQHPPLAPAQRTAR